MQRPLYLFAAQGRVGGAIPHAQDLSGLWLKRGVDVIPVIDSSPPSLAAIRQSNGAIVVGVCNQHFLACAEELKRLDCRSVWVNCMTWNFPQEGVIYRRAGTFDAYVFQSEFQRRTLEKGLVRYGYRSDQGHLIRGEFDVTQWPLELRRRDPSGEFVVGRLARPDLSKWARSTWEIYDRIEHPQRRSVVMGVDDTIRKWIGPAPPWAEVLPPCAMRAQDFYRRIHCLMPINFSALENWPRIGLEAMAMGVPVIAPRQGGWCEMINHGETGFLASSKEEFAEFGTLLAHDELLRQKIALNARKKLETELANPELIWAGWKRLFSSLGADVR